jgi:uncharacterized protein YdeI (YjbR/CyaY-like superfamily)
MNQRNPKVDAILRQAAKWQEEFEALRTIALGCQLTEELKWYQPCYSLGKKNVVLKEYCALMFFKGALLKDPHRILATPGQHQAARQIRFANLQQIMKVKPVLKSYIQEAIEIEKSGQKVKLKKTSDYKVPEEFQRKLKQVPGLKTAFAALTPGRQRGYLYYFSQPKQSKTREARVEKYIQQIFNGKGPDD